MVMAMTTIPTPPNHCNRARHNKIPGGACSRFLKTVAPVVVRPEIDSKKESVNVGAALEKINGREAKAEISYKEK